MSDVRFSKGIAALIACLGLVGAETGGAFSMGNGGNQPTGSQYYGATGTESSNANRGPGYELGSPGVPSAPSYSGYPANNPQQFNFDPQGSGYGRQEIPPNAGYGQPPMPAQPVQPQTDAASAPASASQYGPPSYGVAPQAAPGYGGAPSYGPPPGYGSAPGYGTPQGYGGASGYGPPGYGTPQGYGGAPGYGPPGYGPPQGYGGAPGYGAPDYNQSSSYDNDDSNGRRGPFSGMPSPMRVMPNPMQMFGGNRDRD